MSQLVGVFIMALAKPALAKKILDGRYGSIESRYLTKTTQNVACSILTFLLQQS